jgi:hypothetical protein
MHLYLFLGRATSPRRNCRSSAKNTSRRPRWAGENSRSNHCMMELYQSTPSNSITASVYPSPYARRPVQWIILVTQLATSLYNGSIERWRASLRHDRLTRTSIGWSSMDHQSGSWPPSSANVSDMDWSIAEFAMMLESMLAVLSSTTWLLLLAR